MKRINVENINSEHYWDTHQTATDFGLRQQKYIELANSSIGKNNETHDYFLSICELGCGLSPTLQHADNFGIKVGLDYSPKTVEEARKLYPTVSFEVGEVTKTPFRTNEFDAVICGEVIEHLEKPMELLEEMWRICQWGGIMILSTPILEFNDAEHVWQFSEKDFKEWGFDTEVVESERFPGRSYIFAWKLKEIPTLTHGYLQTA